MPMVETHYVIFSDSGRGKIKVSPDADGLDLFQIEGYGDYGRLVLPREMLKALAECLNKVLKENPEE